MKAAALLVIALASVISCCLLAQCIIRASKSTTIELNEHQNSRAQDKNFVIQRQVRKEMAEMALMSKQFKEEEAAEDGRLLSGDNEEGGYRGVHGQSSGNQYL